MCSLLSFWCSIFFCSCRKVSCWKFTWGCLQCAPVWQWHSRTLSLEKRLTFFQLEFFSLKILFQVENLFIKFTSLAKALLPPLLVDWLNLLIVVGRICICFASPLLLQASRKMFYSCEESFQNVFIFQISEFFLYNLNDEISYIFFPY